MIRALTGSLIQLAALAVTTAHTSDGYVMQDPDERNACLARTR